jgi:hypothetical protein
MPIPQLRPPRAYASDGPGPFTSGGGGRDLRILVDLPAEQRQMDDSVTTFDQLGVPDAVRFLWTLGQRDDIAVYWISGSDEADADGAVRLHEPDRDRDQLPFTALSAAGCGPYGFTASGRISRRAQCQRVRLHLVGCATCWSRG